MKKNGFTLVELLAIISLIAILGLISVPIVNNVISKSEIKIINQVALQIVNSANIYNSENDFTAIGTKEVDLKKSKIQFENKDKLEYGKIAYYKNKGYLLVNVYYDGYCINGFKENLYIEKQPCRNEEYEL